MAPITPEEMATLERIAEAMHESGDYKDITSKAQALNRILIGRDLGLSPAQAMMSIDLVRGNLMIRGVQLAAFVRRSPDYDYEVLKHTENGCQLSFKRRVAGPKRIVAREVVTESSTWEHLGESIYTIEDAAHAKLIKDGSAWQTVPKSMVFWRAMSNGVKWYCPDLLGGVPVYTEADDITEPAQPGDGTGDGEEPGWRGISMSVAMEIERVIERAVELGHAGLSDRARAQMELNGQDAEEIQEWLSEASAELDALEGSRSEAIHEGGDTAEPVEIPGQAKLVP